MVLDMCVVCVCVCRESLKTSSHLGPSSGVASVEGVVVGGGGFLALGELFVRIPSGFPGPLVGSPLCGQAPVRALDWGAGFPHGLPKFLFGCLGVQEKACQIMVWGGPRGFDQAPG